MGTSPVIEGWREMDGADGGPRTSSCLTSHANEQGGAGGGDAEGEQKEDAQAIDRALHKGAGLSRNGAGGASGHGLWSF